MSKLQALENIAKKACEVAGVALWGIEFSTQGHSVFRVYIERPIAPESLDELSEGGVTVDDCERVSRQLSALLDVEDPIPEAYSLEVSSPGLRRRLFRVDQYAAYIGVPVQLSLFHPVDKYKRINSGILSAVDERGIKVQVEQQELAIEHNNIDRIFVDLTIALENQKGQKLKAGKKR